MSHNLTCAVSGFPISDDDPVRFFLLNKQAVGDHRPVYPTSLWAPRTFPLKAKYNDHGSVKDVEEGFARDLWIEGFQRDLVEVGYGNNTTHDVAVLKDMSFEQFLEALRKSRVAVRRYSPPVYDEHINDLAFKARAKAKAEEVAVEGVTKEPAPPFPKTKIEKGIPTLRRVMARLEKAGLPIFNKVDDKDTGYLVDKLAPGLIRVRWGGHNERSPEVRLREAKRKLRRYATMITPSSTGHGDEADLIVCARPGVKSFFMPWGRDWSAFDPRKTINVNYAMIREDVWQELLQGTVEGLWVSSEDHTLQDYKDGIRKYVTERRERRAAIESKEEISFSDCFNITSGDEEWSFSRKVPGAWILARDRGIRSGIGPDEHWELLEAKGTVPDEFLDVVAEFAFVTDKLEQVRYWWRPSFNIGPDSWGWVDQRDFYQRMARIAEKNAQHEEDYFGESDESGDDGDDDVDLDEDDDECDAEESPAP